MFNKKLANYCLKEKGGLGEQGLLKDSNTVKYPKIDCNFFTRYHDKVHLITILIMAP